MHGGGALKEGIHWTGLARVGVGQGWGINNHVTMGPD